MANQMKIKAQETVAGGELTEQWQEVTRTPVGAKNGLDVTSADNFLVRLDDTTTANVTYVGYADPGTAASAAAWRIKKIDETSGMVVTWADGNVNFDNIWNDRASLSYS